MSNVFQVGKFLVYKFSGQWLAQHIDYDFIFLKPEFNAMRALRFAKKILF